jgi:hypothetical protein
MCQCRISATTGMNDVLGVLPFEGSPLETFVHFSANRADCYRRDARDQFHQDDGLCGRLDGVATLLARFASGGTIGSWARQLRREPHGARQRPVAQR